jgi:hypothetical protein
VAQAADSASGALRALVTLGSRGEEEARLGQLRGSEAGGAFLLRSPSTLTPWSAGASAALIVPEALFAFNSRFPYSHDDGALWAGKGASALVMSGLLLQAGPLRLVLAPELTWSENRDFGDLTPPAWDSLQPGSFQPPWNHGRDAVDLPFRMGPGATTRLLPGQSSLTLRLGPLGVGAASEQQWWGPGNRWAVLFSNQAGGFGHLFLRTERPLRTPLGRLSARWISGALQGSEWRNDTTRSGWRSLSAAALVLQPGGAAGPSLGVARAVYSSADDAGQALGRPTEVFTRWRREGNSQQERPYEQMLTVFGRWVFPAAGAEVYGEWGRYQLPKGARELLVAPEHTQGYVLGGQWLRPAGQAAVRLQAELTFLERSPTYATRRIGSWYASAAVPEGFTQQGQPVGAGVGPGGSGQWLAADWLRRDQRLGLFLGRTRWANDAYYDQLTDIIRRYRGHDVSVLGGVRAGTALGPFALDASWTLTKRYNLFFQNTGLDFTQRGPEYEVDAYTHTLQLRLSARPPRLRR